MNLFTHSNYYKSGLNALESTTLHIGGQGKRKIKKKNRNEVINIQAVNQTWLIRGFKHIYCDAIRIFIFVLLLFSYFFLLYRFKARLTSSFLSETEVETNKNKKDTSRVDNTNFVLKYFFGNVMVCYEIDL